MVYLGLPLQDETTIITVSGDEFSCDVIKKEVIDISKDPLKIDEKGEMFSFNYFKFCAEHLRVLTFN